MSTLLFLGSVQKQLRFHIQEEATIDRTPQEVNAADQLLDIALSALQEVAGETVTYSGMTISAVVSSTAIKDVWESGGHIIHRGANIAIRGADLNGAVPQVGELIISKGQTYQIEAVNAAAEGYELTCAEAIV